MNNFPMSEADPEFGGLVRHEGYAFLNHSTTSLQDHLSPGIDDRPLARQKRKRTSPEDQSVLEAAYKRDPKPDKAARSELVKQVSLSDKAVQIWFQNRRQNSRRKSRPLYPHEVAQYHLSRSDSEGSLPGLQVDNDSGLEYHQDSNASMPSSEFDLGNASLQQTVSALPRTIHSSPLTTSRHFDVTTSDRLPSISTNSHVGYLANRRSAPTLHSSFRLDTSLSTLPSSTDDAVPRMKSSLVRLTMTSDGTAEVITKDASSPSPPRPIQTSEPLGNVICIPAPSEVRSISQSRSRDSRSWEFWCDKESRSELENKAEQHSSGSAVGAIGLLRSGSGRSVLGNIPSKKNSPFLRHQSSAKRAKLGPRGFALQKSYTAVTRLQNGLFREDSSPKPIPPKISFHKSATSIRIPGNDSDKENWSPGRDSDVAESTGDENVPSQHVSLDFSRKPSEQMKSAKSKHTNNRSDSVEIFQSNRATAHDPEADAELAAFMRGGRTSSSPSNEDDLDCIQGLLSLSQGNWR